MKTYEKYKPSGIDWIGDIPEHWEVKKLKFLGDAIIGITYSPDDVVNEGNGTLVLRASNIQDGRLAFEDNVFIAKEIDPKLRTKLGDIVICARNGSAHLVGKNALIDEEHVGLTFGAFMVVYRSQYEKLLYHFFNSQIFKSQTGLYSTSTINQLTSSTLDNTIIALPLDRNEQTAIADYLDSETARIDEVVGKKKRLIELLKEERLAIINHAVTRGLDERAKLKPSNIEWLGDIPEHWEIKRLKWFFQLSRGVDLTTEDFVNGDVPVYGSNGCIGLHDQALATGPGITVGRSGSVGEVNFVDRDYWPHNTALYVYRNFGNDWKYLYYFLTVLDLKMMSSGSVVGTLNRNHIHDSHVALPGFAEQRQIVEYIETKTQKIDATVAKVEKEIALLNEYRTALISEVVRGKVKVS